VNGLTTHILPFAIDVDNPANLEFTAHNRRPARIFFPPVGILSKGY
jgi:hypothetical protein